MMFKRTIRKPHIDIIPMLDIALFLLFFFLFTTTFRTAASGIPLELPNSSQGTSIEKRVVVSIDKNGRIYYGSEPVSLHRLITTLQPLVADDPNLLVIINADTKATYGKLIEVMDAIASAGVTMPALGVEKAEKRL
ncbi:MAG TPA: biopolymer transporter ExbD [Bacillota bacterium]